MIPVRTKLVPVAGVASSYDDPKNPGQKLDVSQLTVAHFLTPDTNRALHQLDWKIQESKGKLYLSDLYRSWSMQAKAYEDWLEGKREDYVAPPGKSFHMAGRAIDIDINHLGFGENKEHWLDILWGIALPLGWEPIVDSPKMGQSEAWHFQFLGDDWSKLKATDGEIAQCAILDAGQWEQNDPNLQNKFLQAQLNRLQRLTNARWLVLDGDIGKHTRQAMKALQIQSCTVETAIEKLVTM